VWDPPWDPSRMSRMKPAPCSTCGEGRFRTNGALAANEGAVQGLGIASAPLWQVRPLLDRGAVELILTRFELPPIPTRRFGLRRGFCRPRPTCSSTFSPAVSKTPFGFAAKVTPSEYRLQSGLLRNRSGASQRGDLPQMRDCSVCARRVGEEIERHILITADRR
jgi:hypothetical protein